MDIRAFSNENGNKAKFQLVKWLEKNTYEKSENLLKKKNSIFKTHMKFSLLRLLSGHLNQNKKKKKKINKLKVKVGKFNNKCKYRFSPSEKILCSFL